MQGPQSVVLQGQNAAATLMWHLWTHRHSAHAPHTLTPSYTDRHAHTLVSHSPKCSLPPGPTAHRKGPWGGDERLVLPRAGTGG